MENWYKPGPVIVTLVAPDPRPRPSSKTDWRRDSDLSGYQANTIERIRRRIRNAKRR